MNMKVLAVGKLKEKFIRQGIEDYRKKLSKYVMMDMIEVPDEKAPENMSKLEMEQVKEKEGERLLSHISKEAYVITLEIGGQMLDTDQFAKKLKEVSAIAGEIVFVIGGSLGLSKQVMKRSNYALSFSKMTFPHQLMRLVLLEQIYRAYRISK